MKKVLKIMRNILFVIVGLLAITSIVNAILLVGERRKYKPVGDLVEVYDKEYIHAVKMGNGKYAILILAGLGQPAPYYEFKKLATELSKKYTVIILEELGYGYSSISKKERSLENYESEYSKVLEHYGVKDNIILMLHSMSGLTGLYYANKHKESVKGMVCMDCTTSYQYEDMKDMPKTPNLISYLSKLGLTRVGIKTITKSLYNAYTADILEEDLSATDYIIYEKYMNQTVINEQNSLVANLLALQGEKYDNNLHVTNVLASETTEQSNEMGLSVEWQKAHEDLMTNTAIQKNVILSGPHMIYQHNVDKISNITDEMIDSIENFS